MLGTMAKNKSQKDGGGGGGSKRSSQPYGGGGGVKTTEHGYPGSYRDPSGVTILHIVTRALFYSEDITHISRYIMLLFITFVLHKYKQTKAH